MRRSAKVDSNQAEIVQALEAVGASVRSLAAVGQGFPDLACGFRGKTYILEIKRPKAKGQREGTLTPDQKRFFSEWRGQAAIVQTADEALRVIGAVKIVEGE